MMLEKLFILILVMGVVSAVDVDFDCPDDIYVDEEFECSVEVFDGDGIYDLKIEVDEERDSILRIWDGEVWKSGYYYLIDFIDEDEVVKLTVSEEGKYDVVVKLRDGEWKSEFDVGRIRVLVGEDVEEENLDTDSTDSKLLLVGVNPDANLVEKSEGVEVINLNRENEVIVLGGDVVTEDEEWNYVSKDGLIVDWLLYGFCLFLIFLVGVLVWDKF